MKLFSDGNSSNPFVIKIWIDESTPGIIHLKGKSLEKISHDLVCKWPKIIQNESVDTCIIEYSDSLNKLRKILNVMLTKKGIWPVEKYYDDEN